jgi:GGDEF domain-containing protein
VGTRWVRGEPDRLEGRYRELFDAETGLAGELLLRDRLSVSLARARRFNRSVLVVWFELHTPPAGSETHGARRVAGALHDAIRPDDTLARVGEWEFVVLCNDLAHEDAVERIVRRLHAAMRRATPRPDGAEPLARLGTAIGHSGEHPHTLLEEARARLRPVRVATGTRVA